MMINRIIYVLKGQHILAQGNALGLRKDARIIREIKFIKEKFLFRTKEIAPYFIEKDVLQFRPKEIICIARRILADGFVVPLFTQGGVSNRSSRNFTLGYDILALQAGTAFANDFCITS